MDSYHIPFAALKFLLHFYFEQMVLGRLFIDTVKRDKNTSIPNLATRLHVYAKQSLASPYSQTFAFIIVIIFYIPEFVISIY